jgi:hypothetical protein
MNSRQVLDQIRDIYSRMIYCSLSMKQNFPAVNNLTGGGKSIGDLRTTAIALRDIPYEEIYQEIDGNDAYHIKMPDGGLLIFQYQFDGEDALVKQRLAFFPCADLPSYEEAPFLYENDELYGDVTLTRLVRFPIRIDYHPLAYKEIVHPHCHLTLGQFDGCRIPVSGPVMPNTFLMFLLRNFYARAYIRNKNRFDKKMGHTDFPRTITNAEMRISHFVMR